MMPAVKGDGMRGLAVFISDIRNCKSKEAEVKRINKELANIRNKFKGDKTLDGYQKKKYVCKLLFIFLLGHDIDFGQMEAINLLSSNKYTEKQIGYLFISVLINTNSDLIKLIVQNIKNDLASNNPVHVSLAMQCIANIGSKDMVDAFGQEIPRLLVSPEAIDVVKQSAALCLLRLFRTSPEVIPGGEWVARIIHLLNDQHMGVVTAAVSLIDALVKHSADEYKGCVPLTVSRLHRIVTATYQDLQDYTYYFVPAPWLCVKLLRLLQNYPSAPEDSGVRSRLNECLDVILNKAMEPPKSKKAQHSNAKNAILFEAISLIIHSDSDSQLLIRACNQLGQFLTHRETNLRYLALESMCLLATSELSHEAVKKHQETVINALKNERDVSVRQRAVDLLYAMCDRTNAETIVQEMLNYLELADYSIREEMVLKVAILSEKYAADYTWYVDVILNLIRIAGDYVSEEVWYRVIQIVINREDVQGYAAKTVFETLQAPACHENMVKVGGYILGEFGNLIAGDSRSTPIIQFRLLHSKYNLCSVPTRAILLSTYIKFINLFSEIRPHIEEVLHADNNLRSADVELQQRACEYLKLSRTATPTLLATVLDEMPSFPERESSILAALKKKSGRVSETTSSAPVSAKTPSASTALNSSLDSPAPTLLVDNAGTSNTDLLVNVLTNDVAKPHFNAINDSSDACNALKFVTKNNGVLFENSIIQVGVKSDYRQNLGRIGVFFGNKTPFPFMSFLSTVSGECISAEKLMVQLKPVEAVIEAGAQVQQLINVECLDDFLDYPNIHLSFMYNGAPQSLNLKLPVSLNKFFQKVQMNSTVFFTRWKALSGPSQEAQRIFKCEPKAMEPEAISACLNSFGLQVLDAVDPIVDNFVCAGIITCKCAQVGCLLRLEPSRQAQMVRLTIRSSREKTSQYLLELLSSQLQH